jgi:uncharacterized repeat protein (TIGR01451 family)
VLAPIRHRATRRSGIVLLALTGLFFAQNQDASACVIVGVADLTITKTDGVSTAVPGGSVTYTITASNDGPDPVTGGTVTDTFPASLTATWTCVGAGGGTCTAGPSAGNISDSVNLPVGGSVTYTATASISPAATGTLSNTAGVSSANFDPTPASATDNDTLTPQADLGITKTDGVTTAVPGGSVTYTITASNPGPSDVTGATVTDTFPASVTATWTCVGAGGGTCTAGPSAGNISDTVNLPAGGSVTYTANASISPSATGTLSNTATVTAPGGVTDSPTTNNSATDNDTLTPQADLGITKTDGVTTAVPGGSVTYTIVASNPGPSDVTGATVTDTFPATLTATWTCVGAGGGTCTAGPSAGNISDTVNLPAGGSVTYTANASISPSATGTLSNTATVTAPGGVTDSPTTNNSATDNDTLTGTSTPGITVTSPNGGESWARSSTHTIRWDYGNAPQGHIKIVLLRNGNVVRTIVADRPIGSNGHGNFNWTLPANLVAGGGYKIRISTTNLSPGATDTSNAAFSIT